VYLVAQDGEYLVAGDGEARDGKDPVSYEMFQR
jgi:hypothetical protein